jgi:hypothetical protein
VSGHTARPWHLRHVSGNNFAVQEFEIRGDYEGKPLFPIFNRDSSAIDGTTIYCSPQDARLIAASPDLYEALRELVATKDFHDQIEIYGRRPIQEERYREVRVKAWDAARAALARAVKP